MRIFVLVLCGLKWMHQMSDTDADSEHHRTGDDLVNGLYRATKLLVSE